MLTTAHVCSWGIADAHRDLDVMGTGSGITYDFNKACDPIQAPEHNEIGQVIGQTLYDKRTQINCTLQVAHGVTPPADGTMVTVDNETYYLTNSALTESNQSYSRYSVTLERYHQTSGDFVTVNLTGSET